MVRLHGIENAVHRDHSVPGAVRLEIVRLGVLDRMRFLERAEVRDQLPAPVGGHTRDPVWQARDAVGTAGPREDRVERPVEKRDVRDAAHERSGIRTRLRGREAGGEGRAVPVRVDPRDARPARRARVGADRRRNLFALADRGRRAPRPALGHIEITVRPELQAARRLEPAREDRHRSGRGRRPPARGKRLRGAPPRGGPGGQDDGGAPRPPRSRLPRT